MILQLQKEISAKQATMQLIKCVENGIGIDLFLHTNRHYYEWIEPNLSFMMISCLFISVNLREDDKVNLSHFELIQVLGTGGKLSDHPSIYINTTKVGGFYEFGYSHFFFWNINVVISFLISLWNCLPCTKEGWQRWRPIVCNENTKEISNSTKSENSWAYEDRASGSYSREAKNKTFVFLVLNWTFVQTAYV